MTAILKILACGLMLVAIAGLKRAGTTEHRSEAVLTCVNQVETLTGDLEMDSRGYILTGDPHFLRSYTAARAALPRRLTDLERTSAQDDPGQGRRAHLITRAVGSYLRDYADPLMRTASMDHAAARSVMLSGTGVRRLASLRDSVATFGDTQRSIAEERRRHSRKVTQLAALTGLATTVLSLLLIFSFIGYLMKTIVGPVRRIAAVTGKLAGGDLSVRMPETSPGEIGVLESRFNAMARSLMANREKVAQAAKEQSALRRVATSVAHGVPPSEIFTAVATELGSVLGGDHANLVRFEPDDMATTLGSWYAPGVPRITIPLAGRWPIETAHATAAVRTTGKPVRMTRRDYQHDDSAIGAWVRSHGIRLTVGYPITVEGRVWGAAIVASRIGWPSDIEDRMLEFVELVGTAIANAQSRTELLASRDRVVAAADESRRRIERDLHDGIQQELVALGFRARAAQDAVAPCQERLRAQMSGIVHDLRSALREAQEVSRGILPGILSRRGLAPALRSLARRSPIPVELGLCADHRLPATIEVALYYTASEALTNVAKHAQASRVWVDLAVDEAAVRLSVRDDGVGGADPAHGSGLLGLRDRVDALGGEILLRSTVESGTVLLVNVPIGADDRDGTTGVRVRSGPPIRPVTPYRPAVTASADPAIEQPTPAVARERRMPAK